MSITPRAGLRLVVAVPNRDCGNETRDCHANGGHDDGCGRYHDAFNVRDSRKKRNNEEMLDAGRRIRVRGGGKSSVKREGVESAEGARTWQNIYLFYAGLNI